jgi:drug/metabolite transporter (DMT)-like permease
MPLAAVVLIIAACACFTSIDVTVKHLSQRYPVPLLVWARWGVQALLMFALLAPTMRWNLVRTTRPGADRIVAVFFHRGQVSAAGRGDRAQLHEPHPGDPSCRMAAG